MRSMKAIWICVKKISTDLTTGSSIVFTRKAFVDQTYIRDSSNGLHRNSWI